MLVDRPGKLVVQLPGDEGHEHRSDCEHAGYGDQERIGLAEEVLSRGLKRIESIAELVLLDRGVDQLGDVQQTYADDLDRVLETQGVDDQDELVDTAEDEQGEEGRNG